MDITCDNKGLTPEGDWIFKPNPNYDYQTGYEDVLDELHQFDCADFRERYTELEKEKMVDKLFEIYRSINIFPIKYYSQKGMEDEVVKTIKKCDYLQKDGKYLANKYIEGNHLCRYLFPAIHGVGYFQEPAKSMFNRFYKDKWLRQGIKLTLNMNKTGGPGGLYNAFTLAGHTTTNFKPVSAKALYEYFTPPGGLIHDSSCGFGGRLMGALTSYNNYQYIGTDPNTAIQKPLHKLGDLINDIQGRKDTYKIFCLGSEKFRFKGTEEIADFSFTSPPYFNLELYSDEATQSYNEYNNIKTWVKYFLAPTIYNTYRILKPGAYYALNITDFANDGKGGKQFKYVDTAIQLAEAVGFTYLYKIDMRLTMRTGSGQRTRNDNSHGAGKMEGIYVFQKR